MTILLTFIFFLLSFVFASAQVPHSFNYQAVARNNGEILKNTALDVRLTLVQGSQSGTAVWSETQGVTTNAYGLFILEAGSVTPVDVDWDNGPFFLKVEIDLNDGNGFVVMGTAKMLSVPYALYATDVQNRDDADADPANEIQDLQLNGNLLTITKNGSATTIDLTPYLDNPGWDKTGDTLSYHGSVAVGTEVAAGSKLMVQGDDVSSEEPLFEVKRKDGQTVFAVYNEGVRVYVADSGSKGPRRSGFAIGGFGQTKGGGQEYLRVTPDSVRIYIDPADAKGPRGGFAIGGFGQTKGAGQEYLRVTDDSTRVYFNDQSKGPQRSGFAIGGFGQTKGSSQYFNVSGAASADVVAGENRVLWYPKKNAFLAGRILVESPDSVGTNSFSSGYESRALGEYSQALGYKARAKGDNSTAIGNNANAEGTESYAIGNFANTTRQGSYAIGSGASAIGLRSFALGSTGIDSAGVATSPTKATADYAYAFGMGSEASGQGAIAMGTQNKAKGDYSLALGYNTVADEYYSTAMGYKTTASGKYSTAMGYETNASEDGSTAIGIRTLASGHYSTAMGAWTTASRYASTAMGDYTTASGVHSTAIGTVTTASGNYSTALGLETIAGGGFSTTLGYFTTASGSSSTAMGYKTTSQASYSLVLGRYNIISGNSSSWISTDPLFVIGNGSSATSRHNAMTVLKNGNVGIGATNPSQKLDVDGYVRTWGIIGRHINAEMLKDHDNGNVTVNALGNRLHLGYTNTKDIYFLTGTGTGVGSTKMVISQNGFVGIGTTNPYNKLDVAGNIELDGYLIGAHGTIAQSTDEWLRLNPGNSHTSGIYASCKLRADGGLYVGDDEYFYRGAEDRIDSYDHLRIGGEIRQGVSDYGAYEIQTSGQIYTNDYLIAMGGVHVGGSSDPGTENLIVDNRVGIGTTSPAYPLHVETAVNSNFSYGYLNSEGKTGTNTATVAISIFAQRRIRAEEFNADSDIRIKNVKGKSNAKKDLELLKQVCITDYQYIDTISKGTKIHKKVIAQELKQIYPGAVNVTTGFVPSVYSKATSLTYDKSNARMMIVTAKNHGFNVGDNVKLIHKEGIFTTNVVEVPSEKTFVVVSNEAYPELFVFGKKVNDFLTVDYEAIAMLNVSATQELIRNNEKQQETIEILQKEVEKLKNEKSELAALKARISEMEMIVKAVAGKEE